MHRGTSGKCSTKRGTSFSTLRTSVDSWPTWSRPGVGLAGRRASMRGLSVVGTAALAAALLAACGSSQPTTHSKAPCPTGQALVAGHFHGEYCVPSAGARIAAICFETRYELTGIIDRTLRNPQPGALQGEFESAARESAATMQGAIRALRSSGENASKQLSALANHRSGMLAYGTEVHRERNVVQNFGRWLRSLYANDLACGPLNQRITVYPTGQIVEL